MKFKYLCLALLLAFPLCSCKDKTNTNDQTIVIEGSSSCLTGKGVPSSELGKNGDSILML